MGTFTMKCFPKSRKFDLAPLTALYLGEIFAILKYKIDFVRNDIIPIMNLVLEREATLTTL